MPNILPVEDTEVSQTLEKSLTKQGIRILTGTKVEKAEATGKGVRIKVSGKTDETIESSLALVAIGVSPLLPEGVALALDERGYIKTNDNYIYGINLIKDCDDKIYVSTSMEKYLEVWDKKSLTIEKRIKLKEWVNDIAFKNDKIFIANANIISVFDKDLNLIEENENHSDEVYSLQFYDNKLITASNDSFVRIWKVN